MPIPPVSKSDTRCDCRWIGPLLNGLQSHAITHRACCEAVLYALKPQHPEKELIAPAEFIGVAEKVI
jgi:hypothetical protein